MITLLACEIYAVTTVVITAIWTWSAKSYSLRTLSWAMFFPGLFVPWFNKDPYFVERLLGYKDIKSPIILSVISVVYVICVMALVLVINYMFGWADRTDFPGNKVRRTSSLIVSFLKVIGEEVGWRCYLLPCLLQKYSNIMAIFISGIIWALYHVPIMVLLTKRFSVRHRWKTVIVQSLQCVLSTFPFAYVAVHSGFSLWAPAVMHFTWNELNPLLFGSIYTQQRGHLLNGQQWLINGEGLAGCLASIPAVLFTVASV